VKVRTLRMRARGYARTEAVFFSGTPDAMSHWDDYKAGGLLGAVGTTAPPLDDPSANQRRCGRLLLSKTRPNRRVFLFLNWATQRMRRSFTGRQKRLARR
jgi:hypothetical protein